MAYRADLDAHARPPENLRILFKKIQKASPEDLALDEAILDFENPSSVDLHASSSNVGWDLDNLRQAIGHFLNNEALSSGPRPSIYEAKALPGLLIYPGLLSSPVQAALLDKLLHRDLANPEHLTNVHLFHEMIYPEDTRADAIDKSATLNSFFAMNSSTLLEPKDPAIHKPMSIAQMMRRKLRWMTLGGQYDWTNKVYPDEEPPSFPVDIADLLKAFFPTVDAQAAIVNLYTPGDTLSVHRDVSEECDRGLISVSIGCDAIFMVGNEDGSSVATMRLRSGDAILMTGSSRYAWHAVPKVLGATCPASLSEWPHTPVEPAYQQWRGWMQTKRINLNVRQMKQV